MSTLRRLWQLGSLLPNRWRNVVDRECRGPDAAAAESERAEAILDQRATAGDPPADGGIECSVDGHRARGEG